MCYLPCRLNIDETDVRRPSQTGLIRDHRKQFSHTSRKICCHNSPGSPRFQSTQVQNVLCLCMCLDMLSWLPLLPLSADQSSSRALGQSVGREPDGFFYPVATDIVASLDITSAWILVFRVEHMRVQLSALAPN